MSSMENQARELKPGSSKATPVDLAKEMGHTNARKLSYEDLACYTDNFSESNYLSHFQFGKLYRGKIVWPRRTQYVIVKIWEEPEIYNYMPGDNEGRLMDEVTLLRHEMLISQPGMVKLYGYCNKADHLGVVYEFELEPFDSIFNLIPKDDFTWLQRIKVALQFAFLLRFLHTVKCSFYKPFIVRNLDCAHIVVDKDYNAKLCDFGLISGGICPDRTTRHQFVLGSYGYIDVDSIYQGVSSVKQDVFAFGVILVNLISKRVYDVETRGKTAADVNEWAWREFLAYDELLDRRSNWKNTKFSLVHQSLIADPDFEAADEEKLSMLAVECMKSELSDRPTMKQITRSLLKLKVVNKHRDFFGVKKRSSKCI